MLVLRPAGEQPRRDRASNHSVVVSELRRSDQARFEELHLRTRGDLLAYPVMGVAGPNAEARIAGIAWVLSRRRGGQNCQGVTIL
jgi:hypothetical protein